MTQIISETPQYNAFLMTQIISETPQYSADSNDMQNQ